MELAEEKIQMLKSLINRERFRHVSRDTEKISLPVVIYEQCSKQKMVYINVMGSKS